MVRQMQTFSYGKRYSNTELDRKTDYIKLAEAFGAKAARVSDLSSFESALRQALQTDGPYLIEVPIDQNELVLPMLSPDGAMADLITEIKEEA